MAWLPFIGWTLVVAMCGLTGCLAAMYYQEGQIQRLQDYAQALADDANMSRRKLVRLNARLDKLERPDDTGPIPVLDKPTLAQLAAPTRPDFEAQPPVANGATAVGRHRLKQAAK
jgi:hypothetical protein